MSLDSLGFDQFNAYRKLGKFLNDTPVHANNEFDRNEMDRAGVNLELRHKFARMLEDMCGKTYGDEFVVACKELSRLTPTISDQDRLYNFYKFIASDNSRNLVSSLTTLPS